MVHPTLVPSPASSTPPFPSADDGAEDVPRLQPIEIEEYNAARAIQRIARGRQARHYVERRRTKFNKAATRIQARARGMRDRRKVTWAWKLYFGAIAVQRIVRGRLARVRVATMRRFRRDTRYVVPPRRAQGYPRDAGHMGFVWRDRARRIRRNVCV
jgi:hypothetical protein